MATICIHIFNPETDYALAAGDTIYNPPARIAELRRRMALLPASFAADGDWIAVRDADMATALLDSKSMAICRDKGLRVIPLGKLADEISRNSGSAFSIVPWGWNHTLRRNLLALGIPEHLLKSSEEIDTIRALSHRRTTIRFQKCMQQRLPDIEVPVAEELRTPESAEEYLARHTKAYFKLPWSSSGRGVVLSSSMSRGKLTEWISGGIRRQGSVMGEKAFERTADFATEWECRGGKASFLGLSVFRTSPEGRYLGNICEPQARLDEIISGFSPFWNAGIIKAQKECLEEIIAPYYSGPVGIDMLVASGGQINHCVEINLRQTMGMAAMLKNTGNG